MKIWGKLLLFYLFAMLVFGYAFQTTYKHFRKNALDQRTETQQIAHSSVLQSNRILADMFFNEVLNREDILSLVQQIAHSEGDQQRTQRGLLHRSLFATYQRSKKDVAEILHFHFPDNRSMLRFHMPQKADDDLTVIRPSIVLANMSLQAVHGYESGRVLHGYRHVYPLISLGKHIGSVEASSPYHRIYRQVQHLETASKTQFVFFQKKAGLFEKLFQGQEQYYVANEIHPDFTRLRHIPELSVGRARGDDISAEMQGLFKVLKNDNQVQVNMLQGVAFSQFIDTNNSFFSIVFHPVLNISGEDSSYLIGITPEPQIQRLVDQFWIYYLLTGIILFGILMYRGVLQSALVEKKKTEESLQAFFDNKLIGMVSLDAAGFYQQVNRQWEIMTGYSRDELLTMNFRDLTYPDDLNQKTLYDKVEEENNGQILQVTKRYIRKDGSLFWGDIAGTSLCSDDNQFAGLVGIILDVTDRKQAEMELVQHRDHLEEMVDKRTNDLTEKTEQLQKSEQALTYLLEDVNESREALQKANNAFATVNKELKEFAYIVSHDLKAPLRAISQLTHWIAEDYSAAFDDDGKMQMDLIIQRAKRMDNLIDGILRYSRLGRTREKTERLDLNVLVQEVIDTIAAVENVKVTIENKLPVVVSDAIRMEQVFQNLIGNAIKFTDNGEGIIKVGCVEDETSWTFCIADNGPGIDPQYHEKIFQIFQTLAPRDEHESTGIGLALVKKIIGMYGGSVWVESELGHGATFYFTLPKKGEHDEKF